MKRIKIALLSVGLGISGGAFSALDQYISDINQLADQVKVVKQVGGLENIQKVLKNIEDYRKKYPARLIPPLSDALEGFELQLRDLAKINNVLNGCEETDAQAAKRILSILQAEKGLQIVPACPDNELSPLRKLIEFNHQIAAAALKNDLATALQLRKKYFKNPPGKSTVQSEVDRLCPSTDSYCTAEMKEWLRKAGDETLSSSEYKNISYRDPKQVSLKLADQFAELNYKYVLTANERKFMSPELRNMKVRSLYEKAQQEYKKNPSGEAYKSALKKYESDLSSYKREEGSLKAYAKYAPAADVIDYTSNGKNYGLRNSCDHGGSYSQQLYDKYRDQYLTISGGPDGILLFTEALKKNRLQVDGWISSGNKCPEPYPMNITEAQVNDSIKQAIAETGKTSAVIRKKFSDIQKASSEKEMLSLGADWVRSFPIAVADALAGQPDSSDSVCKMVSELKGKESKEHLRDNVIIGATVISASAMLIVPVIGEGGAAATIALGTGVIAGFTSATANGLNYIDSNSQSEMIVSSIMSNNADLRAQLNDHDLRQKAGEAYRGLILDGAFTALQALEFLTMLPKVALASGSKEDLLAKALAWKKEKAAQALTESASVEKTSEAAAVAKGTASPLAGELETQYMASEAIALMAKEEAEMAKAVNELRSTKNGPALLKKYKSDPDLSIHFDAKKLNPQDQQDLAIVIDQIKVEYPNMSKADLKQSIENFLNPCK